MNRLVREGKTSAGVTSFVSDKPDLQAIIILWLPECAVVVVCSAGTMPRYLTVLTGDPTHLIAVLSGDAHKQLANDKFLCYTSYFRF
jgi:hypothetical protein